MVNRSGFIVGGDDGNSVLVPFPHAWAPLIEMIWPDT